MLEYDGEVLCQSLTIARFLARESGLAGQSALESAQIDEVVDSINDTQLAIVRFYHHLLIIKFLFQYKVHFTKDEKEKEDMMTKLKEETIPKFLQNLEKILIRRGGQYFAGNSVSWAELYFLQFVDLINMIQDDFLNTVPKLKNLDERTRKIPNVAKWLEERPKSDF